MHLKSPILNKVFFSPELCSWIAGTQRVGPSGAWNQWWQAGNPIESIDIRVLSVFYCDRNMSTDETNSLIEQRRAKLAALRARGINPFANKFAPTESCDHARTHYAEGREVALAGRITAHREMGKSMFIDIKDQSGRIQVYAQKQALGDDQFNIFQHLDLGDFIGVRGTMFTTKTGEISVKLVSFTILAKALRPPPEKWHGLVDTEIRYRQRYLDLMANDEVKKTFLLRSAIVREIRNFFHSRGFVEVETPMMQN